MCFPGEIVVCAEGSQDDPLAAKGGLTAISPEEVRAALLERIAERINAGGGSDELEQWKLMLLKTSFHFVAISAAEQIMSQAMQLREHLIVDYSAMARTARQWVDASAGDL